MKVFEINREDLDNNVQKIKQRAGNSKVIAVVKGNAYGLGLKEFTQFLIEREINMFAVSSVDEAIYLSQIYPDIKIICMEVTSIKEDLEQLVERNIILTVGNYETACFLNELAQKNNKEIHVHFKIDTGFSRYGFNYDDKEKILKSITENTAVNVDGVYSHFSYAYSKNTDYTKLQFERFVQVKNYLEENDIYIGMYHIANTSAFLRFSSMYMDAVRIGSAFLGRTIVKNTIGLKRIGVLKSNVIEKKFIKKGMPVGYSNSTVLKRDSYIAIIPIGYSDGFNMGVKNDTFKLVDKVRIIKNNIVSLFKDERIFIIINGKKYPVLGKVGMNHITVDVTNGDVSVGDTVEIDVSPIFVNNRIRREYI